MGNPPPQEIPPGPRHGQHVGHDQPDPTEDFRSSGFKVFSGAVAARGVVKALNAKGLACATQGQIETMTEVAKSHGAKGLAFIKVEGGEWKSPIVKFFSDAEKAALTAKLGIQEGDLILFAADQWLNACEILGKIRLYCAEVLKASGKLVIDPARFDLAEAPRLAVIVGLLWLGFGWAGPEGAAPLLAGFIATVAANVLVWIWI